MTTYTTTDVAERVASKLHSCGWAQDDYSVGGRICLEGAFILVAVELTGKTREQILHDPDYEALFAGTPLGEFWDRLRAAVHEECPDLGVFEFNDLETTTVEDVLLMVKKAA